MYYFVRGATPGGTETKNSEAFDSVEEAKEYAMKNLVEHGYTDVTVEDQFGKHVCDVP